MTSTLSTIAETVSRFKKERFLLSLSEGSFRDEVIRPLFLRKGLKDGRDLCGPFERGKDALFLATDQLGIDNVYVVQTKRGKLNMAKKADANIIESITQLKTALETRVSLIKTKEKKFPTKAILCASGKINDSAREHIVSEVKSAHVEFMDSDDIIPEVDRYYPEFWLGIDANAYPYFRQLIKVFEDAGGDSMLLDVLPTTGASHSTSKKGFVELKLHRTVLKVRKRRGQVTQVPDFQELPVTGILRKRNSLFLIIGEAGSGKSTSIKRLAYLLAERSLESSDGSNIQIPIFLRATEIASQIGSSPSLVEICVDATKAITHSNKGSFTTSDLQAGRVVILVDALDELGSADSRAAVLRLIDEFHQLYPHCRIVVTSRDYTFVKSLRELQTFEKYWLSPISYSEAAQILKNLQKGKGLPQESSQEILRRLQEVHGMDLNPLLVTVFAATSDHSRQDIPANITELFKKFTELMLGRWDASKGISQQYHAPLKDFILAKIAFEMHHRRTTSIDISEFKSIIETELTARGYKADIAQILEEILDRSGLFRTVGSMVEFRHLLLQEFFAGRGIPTAEFLDSIIFSEWWQRAIIFHFGENPGDGKGLERMIRSASLRPIREAYQAALTIGFALQACYLVQVTEKIGILKWVISTLGNARDEFLLVTDPDGKFPLTKFLAYYLFGRDSVALSVLDQHLDEIGQIISEPGLSDDQREIRSFWIIIGLIEAGSLEKAEKLVKESKLITDDRLLLAVHLGCFLIQHLKVSTKEQRTIAKRLSESLQERVNRLRVRLLQEIQSELLEIRFGQIKAIESKPGSS